MAIAYKRIMLKIRRLYLSVLTEVNRLCMHYKQLDIILYSKIPMKDETMHAHGE
jgi:hypothetical protein